MGEAAYVQEATRIPGHGRKSSYSLLGRQTEGRPRGEGLGEMQASRVLVPREKSTMIELGCCSCRVRRVEERRPAATLWGSARPCATTARREVEGPAELEQSTLRSTTAGRRVPSAMDLCGEGAPAPEELGHGGFCPMR